MRRRTMCAAKGSNLFIGKEADGAVTIVHNRRADTRISLCFVSESVRHVVVSNLK